MCVMFFYVFEAELGGWKSFITAEERIKWKDFKHDWRRIADGEESEEEEKQHPREEEQEEKEEQE